VETVVAVGGVAQDDVLWIRTRAAGSNLSELNDTRSHHSFLAFYAALSTQLN
jgi:hypothetical protein